MSSWATSPVPPRGAGGPSRAAHVLQRAPGRRAMIPPSSDVGQSPPAPVVLRPARGPGAAFADRPGAVPRTPEGGERWYRAREVNPESPDDIASLALLSWWSESASASLRPADFPAFLSDFARSWHERPERRLAVLVEEVAADPASTPVPVAMGWVIARPEVAPEPGAGAATAATTDGVFILPGTPVGRIRSDLGAALARLAASRGLFLTPAAARR